MNNPNLPVVPSSYIERVRELLQDGRRKLLGLVGPPGAGKSTLAHALKHAFPDVSQVIPMDGYHLANVELTRLGLSGRKGAPDTFDSASYAALLCRLRAQRPDEIIYAPEFRRELEEPVAGAIPIHPQTRLVITEGNYLLLDNGHWAGVSALLDEIWYVDIEDTLRTSRLMQRHQSFGRCPQDAEAWVRDTDEPNARLIATTQAKADRVFRWDTR